MICKTCFIAFWKKEVMLPHPVYRFIVAIMDQITIVRAFERFNYEDMYLNKKCTVYVQLCVLRYRQFVDLGQHIVESK